MDRGWERRRFLRTMFSAAGLTLAGCASYRTAPPRGDEGEEVEVTPGEDLMQEHGVLERILLIYDEAGRRMDAGDPLDVVVVTRAAGIIRSFIEDYHEKQEEEFVFPRLQRAGRETELVEVLLLQHQRGRLLTDEILRRSQPSSELRRALLRFTRMYRPHAAREDTVLFPAFSEVVGPVEYRELGGRFEEREHELFGEGGFQRVVAQVAELEKALDIHDLAHFTP